MKNRLKFAALLFVAVIGFQPLVAAIRLPGLIGNRMVLQRDTELTLWGWADPGEKVTVRLLGK
ncbi:MAG: 9-O-acetylesterase, partial [Rikenellaceae bacterium]|nr:9-O-acetylesterase [Rikenellaceae bacterium]